MTTKKVIELCATMLNIDEVIENLQDPQQQPLKETQMMLRCLNLVYSETAFDYLPLKTVETVISVDGKIEYKALKRNIIDVTAVTELDGSKAKFKVFPEYISVADGVYLIEYSYEPPELSLDDTIDYPKLTERILAYGTAAEYCVISSRYDEAAMWDKRFKDALAVAKRPKHQITIPKRAW